MRVVLRVCGRELYFMGVTWRHVGGAHLTTGGWDKFGTNYVTFGSNEMCVQRVG
jgi:hypothetical protein